MAANIIINAHSPIPAKKEEPWKENWEPKYQIPRNTKRTAAIPAIVTSILNPGIETHLFIICRLFYKSFLAKSPLRLTTLIDPPKGQISKRCREHSFGSGAISNSCRHGTVTGYGLLISGNTDTIVPCCRAGRRIFPQTRRF